MLRQWERFGDWILFFGMTLVSVGFLVTVNEPMLQGLRARALTVSGAVEGRLAAAGRYLNALEENARLRDENIRLSSDVARSREAMIENRRLRAMLAMADSMVEYRVAARIVYKDITRERNTFTINVGRVDGVREGMAVVEPRGIVGKVVLVSDDYAQVMSFMNTNFVIPGKIQPHQSDGFVRWSGERRDLLEMDHVMRTEPVENGQLVVTSGYSSIFRPGIPIGRVDSVAVLPGYASWQIFLRPMVDIGEVEHVFVILDRPDPERIAIQPPS